MSANTDLFLRGAELVSRGEDAAVLELSDEDIELEPVRAATEGTYRGHDGIRRFLEDSRESFERFELDYTDVRDLGDGRILALGVVHIRGRGSGVETDVPTAVIAAFSDGRLVRFKDYGDRDAALAAAGLA
jgi:ketosteroid isomerase-like protein